MVLANLKAMGEVLEVFDVALDDYVFAGPPGEPVKGRMVHRDEVEPEPFELVLREGLTPWHDR